MSKLLLALLVAATVSGCAIAPPGHNSLAVRMATAPNQGSFLQDVLGGLRRGALAGAGAMSPEVYAEQRGLPPPIRLKTVCNRDYFGEVTCITSQRGY